MGVSELRVSLDKEFKITLESYSSAGYLWETKFDDKSLKLKDKSVEQGSSTLIGNGGKQIFTSIPVKSGEAEIRMLLKRPWEANAEKEKIFKVIITE